MAETEPRVELRPGASSHFRGELAEIEDAIRAVVPEAIVTVRDPTSAPPGISAPPADEVLGVLLAFADEEDAFAAIVDGVVAVARAGWRGRQPAAGSRTVKFYGPEGEVLSEVAVSSDDLEAGDR